MGVASMDSILALFEDGVTCGETTQTRPEGHRGGPPLLDCN